MKKRTAMFMIVTVLFCVSISACGVPEPDEIPEEASLELTSDITATPKPVFIPITEDTVLITPLDSKTPLSAAPITNHGLEWYQEEGYTAFRIWVQNDTDQEMKVTICYDGASEDDKMVFRVPPYEGGGGYVNFATEGRTYSLGFQTPNGVLSGACTVRISEEPFG